jgi:thermitase
MKRNYFKRDQRIEVEEIEGVAAVEAERDAKGERAAEMSTFGRPGAKVLRDTVADLPDEALQAFDRAGWLLVRPSADTRSAIDRGELPAGAVDAGKVIDRGAGRIAIVTRALVVQLDPALDTPQAEAVLAERMLGIVRKLNFAPNLYQVIAGEWEDALEASVDLQDDARFVFAEPEFIEHMPGRAVPTDPDLGDQWQWINDGSNGGTAGADVNIEEAWDRTWGAGVTVAVIDNGFDADHEDLAAGVVTESGYFDNSSNWVQGTAGMPDSNHGTFCAGLVGARRNNGNGGVGAAPDCNLMLLACLVDQVGTQATLARAVAYAVDMTNEVAGANLANGPDILACSLGPAGAVWDLETVLDMALDTAPNGRQGLGLPIFWAASNSNNVDVTQDEVVSHPNVIAVVRSDRNDQEDNAARGDTVELIAPGVDVYSTESGDGYGTDTGNSYATPCAAGCAALALSVNTGLTGAELRQIMRDTADQIGGVVYDATGHNDDYGFGRVNADAAVHRAARRVTLLTSSLVFNDIPEGELAARAVAWEGFGFDDLTFEVVSGPSGPFALLDGSSTVLPAPGVGIGGKAQIWFTYTGTTAGATDSGSVTVRCVETSEQWVVPISANTIQRPTVGVCLVLDKSGSMSADAGDGRDRVEVLREAAQTFVEVAYPDTGLGIVRFDHDATAVMNVIDAGPEIFGPGRVQATGAITSHSPNPMGTTSIGDGVETAAGLLGAVSAAYDETAMIVLTDGQENAPKFIADVADSINDRTFAIGLGEPSVINPAALTALTDNTGGYVVMTGNISSDEYFTLTKYYLQILAGVTNQEIVLDPEGHVKPADTIEIPFDLNRGDSGADVILMCPAPDVMRFDLVTPSGAVIGQGAMPAGSRYIAGKAVGYYRLTLPVVVGGVAAGVGRWRVRLHCDRHRFNEWLQKLEGSDIDAFEHAARHGLRYAIEVHARSSIRMQAALAQKGTGLGEEMHLTARLTEIGLPLAGRAEVVAELSGPQGDAVIPLDEVQPGMFRASVPGDVHGLYAFRILARGKTRRGERFMRERSFTGSIYVPRPPKQEGEPDRPGGGDAPSDDCKKHLQLLHAVIGKYEVVRKPLYEALRREGVNPENVMRCLAQVAMVGRPTSGGLADLGELVVNRPPILWSDIFDALDRPTTGNLRPISREAETLARLLRSIG